MMTVLGTKWASSSTNVGLSDSGWADQGYRFKSLLPNTPDGLDLIPALVHVFAFREMGMRGAWFPNGDQWCPATRETVFMCVGAAARHRGGTIPNFREGLFLQGRVACQVPNERIAGKRFLLKTVIGSWKQ